MIRQYELILSPTEESEGSKVIAIGFIVNANSEDEALSMCIDSLEAPENYTIKEIENLPAFE